MPTPTKEQTEKVAALLKMQNTNGSFDLNDKFCKFIGLTYEAIKRECDEKKFDYRGYATALAMENIDMKLKDTKESNFKAFDKAKLFLFKVWADSQPFMKLAAQAALGGGAQEGQGQGQGGKSKVKLDGDGRPIVADK